MNKNGPMAEMPQNTREQLSRIDLMIRTLAKCGKCAECSNCVHIRDLGKMLAEYRIKLLKLSYDDRSGNQNGRKSVPSMRGDIEYR